VVCEVMCIPDEVRAPRISSTKLPDGTMVSSALEDLWPFLSPEELEENMLEEKE
jgi:acetolactate synthase-1/2/3 large subunit